MSSYYQEELIFLESYGRSGGNVKVELNLSNYTTKVQVRGVTGIDTTTVPS